MEYRNLGYYCPQFIRAMDGTFPAVSYQNRNCIAWGEEFSKYRSVAELIRDSIHELVCSHHTNEPPAAEDIRAIQGMVRQPF